MKDSKDVKCQCQNETPGAIIEVDDIQKMNCAVCGEKVKMNKGVGVKKRYCLNKEMSDPDWVHKKQQDFFALKAAFQRFEFGAAFIPQACFDAHWIIRQEIQRMDEPMKAWKAEQPRYVELKKAGIRGRKSK